MCIFVSRAYEKTTLELKFNGNSMEGKTFRDLQESESAYVKNTCPYQM
jgi:hypothetical protein